jgi:opacity protein-like surface antigen
MRTLQTRYYQKENMGIIRFAVATITWIALIGSFVLAQDSTPKVQVFGGYSLMHMDSGGLSGLTIQSVLRAPSDTFGVSSNFNGWNAEAQYNASSSFGIVADFGGRYGKPITTSSGVSGLPSGNAYSFLAGPVLSYRTKARITPFVHALFGWERVSLSASTITGLPSPVSTVATGSTDFALALGGGVDYKMSRRFAIRLGQLDYFHTSNNLNSFYDSAFGTRQFQGLATHQDNLRISAGIVVQF